MADMTVEQRVFNDNLIKLITSIQQCVMSIADQCRSKKLIAQTVYDEVRQTSGTQGEKARTLILALRDCMGHKKQCFEEFIEILEAEMIFEDLIRGLKEAREEEEKRFKLEAQAKDQVVPDLSEGMLESQEDAETQAQRDVGIHSVSLNSHEVEDPNQDPVFYVPHPSKVAAQTSTDSGISRGSMGSSTDSLEPIQESAEGRQHSTKLDSHQPKINFPVSDRIKNIDRLQAILMNLRMETMQHEAVEADLKNTVTKLNVRLGSTMKQKERTEEALRTKTKEVESLKQRQNTLKADLSDRESQLEELKSELSDSEVEKHHLKEQYEQAINTLRSQLETVSAERDAKETELKETEEKLNDEIKIVEELNEAIRILEEESGDLLHQLNEEQEKRHKVQKQLSKEKRKREFSEKQRLCFFAVIAVVFAIACHLFYLSPKWMQCS